MEQNPHMIAHFMAVGAEKRLEDYHFLRNTYETISGQETQLNRILRMLGEDEFSLNWRGSVLPLGRARSRSAYDFDRWTSAMTLKGNIAYERLRDIEQDPSKHTGLSTTSSSTSRVRELRERRKRLSEQRDLPPALATRGGSVASSARLQALAEYDAAIAESEAKRQRQAEENRLQKPKNDDDESLTEKRREKFKAKFDEENQKYEKLKQQQELEAKNRLSENIQTVEDQPEVSAKNRLSKNIPTVEDQAEVSAKNRLLKDTQTVDDQAEVSAKDRKSSIESEQEKSGDIELISFTVRWEPIFSSTDNKQDEKNALIRLFCQWASPSSSSEIDYFTIERQLGDQEWLPIGEKIEKSENQTQLDIIPSNNDEIHINIPSYFRLKAHLQNGQTFTSKPTDEIFMNLFNDKNIIIPRVEILSENSVKLTWNENENNDEQANLYHIEKKEDSQSDWQKVGQVKLSELSTLIDSLSDSKKCQFRLIMSSTEPEEIKSIDNEVGSEVLTVHNVNDLLNSLHLNPSSPTKVDIDITEDGFKEFTSYKIEYTTADKPDQWIEVSDITPDEPHLTIDNLKQATDYKFRFTPVLSGTTINATDTSQLSLVLDVKTPTAQRSRFDVTETKTPHAPPPQFSIRKLDPTSVLVEATVPDEQTATFEDVYDVYSKKSTPDDEWDKVASIDKEHLNATIENLEENTAYSFKINNASSAFDDSESGFVQEFQYETTSAKQYDPSLFLEKIEKSLENVVNNVMQAAAGHQTLDEPVNKSLNEVIKEVFRDESLVPSEQYGFDTLALSDDLLLYRGPKQMMLKELEVDETVDLSKHYGEIIIHNYRSTKQSVVVREDNGNTRVENVEGDVIIRNVVSDVFLKNEQTHLQLAMNIVGQAFLKGVQGTLVASKFKGIIVVKNVHRP